MLSTSREAGFENISFLYLFQTIQESLLEINLPEDGLLFFVDDGSFLSDPDFFPGRGFLIDNFWTRDWVCHIQ
jgi:hypothetical protein